MRPSSLDYAAARRWTAHGPCRAVAGTPIADSRSHGSLAATRAARRRDLAAPLAPPGRAPAHRRRAGRLWHRRRRSPYIAARPAEGRHERDGAISRLARHDDRRRAQGRQGGGGRRRPGQPRPDGDQGHRAQGAPHRPPAASRCVCGFAGSTADAFTLLERLEKKLEAAPGQLQRAAVELAKDWRTDKYLRNLEAMLIVTDGADLYVITGAGDVLEPEHDVTAIGSGGNYALAAARALYDRTSTPRRSPAAPWRSPPRSASTPTAT